MDSSYNPYQPPAAPLEVAIPAVDLTPASRGQRFANFLIDTFCYYLVAGLVGFAYGIFLVASRGEGAAAGNVSVVASYGLGIGAFLLYFTLLEGATGRTVGKLVTGTRVVREDGEPLTYGRVFKRSLARLIPFEPFSFLGGEVARGWHDTISDTVVVQTRK